MGVKRGLSLKGRKNFCKLGRVKIKNTDGVPMRHRRHEKQRKKGELTREEGGERPEIGQGEQPIDTCQ